MSRVPHIDSDPGSITMLSWPNPYYCRRSRGSASTARNPLPPPATWSSTSPHMAWAKFTRWVVDWWPVCGLFTRWVLDLWPVCGLFTRWVLDWWTIFFHQWLNFLFSAPPWRQPYTVFKYFKWNILCNNFKLATPTQLYNSFTIISYYRYWYYSLFTATVEYITYITLYTRGGIIQGGCSNPW